MSSSSAHLRSCPILDCSCDSNCWLRYPYVISCSGSLVEVHLVGSADALPAADAAPAADTAATPPLATRHLHTISLATYELHESAGGAPDGRGKNLVHGCDLRGDWLACGTTQGLVLAIALPPVVRKGGDDGAAAAAAAPTIHELAGHSKVVGFCRIGAPSVRRTKLYTTSLDKSVRLWSLADCSCLQVVKVGTPVLQLVLVADAAAAAAAGASNAAAADEPAERVIIGCADGTVRLWDPRCRKANKALSTLKFAHKEYVGELRLSSDGSRLLSCSRDGALQLWRRDEKHGYLPDATAVLSTHDLGSLYWRVELLSCGLLGISKSGGLELWRWGARAALVLAADSFSSPMLPSPADSYLMEQAPAEQSLQEQAPAGLAAAAESAEAGGGGGDDGADAAAAAVAPPVLLVAFVGLQRGHVAGAATDVTGTKSRGAITLHSMRCALPSPAAAAPTAAAPFAREPKAEDGTGDGDGAAPPPPPPPANWSRWCEVAAEEGVAPDEALQTRLRMMESVASKAGRELAESSVRAYMKRCAVREID